MQASGDVPVMPLHKLTANKKTRAFKDGETVVCFISKMTDGRFSVMNGHFLRTTHYEVFTEKELHESFTES